MIISASRRTDIPAYYAEWFERRVRDGFLWVRNPMNARQVSEVSLDLSVVDCIVFWTKNPIPLLERLDSFAGYPYYVQFTLTGYGRDIEPGLPDKQERLVPAFRQLASAIGPARVPNDEVRLELRHALAKSSHPKLVALMRESADLLENVMRMDEAAVAEGFRRVHERDCSPLFYNNEQALRAVVKSSLVAAIDDYARIEELPGGKGFADVAYLPSRGSDRPALLVELKWNKSTTAALEQIRDNRYPESLRGLDVPILLVGITYDAKTREHECQI